jgi:hypothetical protein
MLVEQLARQNPRAARSPCRAGHTGGGAVTLGLTAAQATALREAWGSRISWELGLAVPDRVACVHVNMLVPDEEAAAQLDLTVRLILQLPDKPDTTFRGSHFDWAPYEIERAADPGTRMQGAGTPMPAVGNESEINRTEFELPTLIDWIDRWASGNQARVFSDDQEMPTLRTGCASGCKLRVCGQQPRIPRVTQECSIRAPR